MIQVSERLSDLTVGQFLKTILIFNIIFQTSIIAYNVVRAAYFSAFSTLFVFLLCTYFILKKADFKDNSSFFELILPIEQYYERLCGDCGVIRSRFKVLRKKHKCDAKKVLQYKVQNIAEKNNWKEVNW